MKKRIVPIFATICLCMSALPSTTIVEAADKEYKITDYMVAKKYYEDVVSDEGWKATISRAERGEKLQLDNEMMDNMSTDTLIEAVLDYPFFMDVYAFNDIQSGFDIMYNTFDGVRTLSERADVGSVMLKKYNQEEVLFKESDDTNVYRLSNLEILLAQNFVTEKLEESEKVELIKLASEKMTQKTNSNIYGGFTETLFFDLLKENATDATLAAQAESMLASMYNSTVYTPNGTGVSVNVYTSEPLTTSQISAYDSQTAILYPNAIKLRSASGKYNCHSYAWYSQSTSNNVWMNVPDAYWTDGSYSYVPSPVSTNKMVYFNGSVADHSGIVYYRYSGPSINFMDLVDVDSKWGPYGLYRHRGNDCPYLYCSGVGYFS